jgi:hypothetical protein
MSQVLSMQELFTDWLFLVLTKINDPTSLRCSLFTVSKGINANQNTTPSSTPSNADKDITKIIPSNFQNCLYPDGLKNDEIWITEIPDDHAKLWIDWIKICVGLTTSTQIRVS